MNHVAIFIRTESADYYNLLVTFKNPQDIEQILLDRIYESPCNWCDVLVESDGGDALDETIKNIISDLIEDCLKDSQDSEDF